jgi:hypothetical protein
VAILDPARGYLPILEAHLPPGGAGQWEEIESREIEPGVWFPVAVRTRSSQAQTPASVQAVPRLRFTDIRVNDPDFARLLAPELPTGSTVADMVRGARHVVDRNRALNVTGGESSSSRAEEAERADGWDLDGEQEGIESVYRLDVNEVLKRIAPPFVAGRGAFILRHEPDVAPALEEAFENTVYVWQGGGDEKPTVRYAGMGFLSLSEILQGVCGLEIIEYHGPEDLLGLRLTGDWMVRRGAGKEVLLRSLERIVYEETSLRIRFEKHRVETPVVRATGIFQYHGLGGTWGEVDVQLFSEAPEAYRSPYRTGAGSGCLAELLRHTGNRISRPFVDDTLSSDVVVSWSDYRSSKLNPLTMDRKRYRQDLARLLDNLAKQTGLTFTEERRAIDRWDVGISP